MMKGMTLAAFLVATCVAAPPVYAQQVPATPAEVAKPGGKIPGAPKLALVKVADGFHDPVGVTAANDGSGRIFVVERAGRVRVVGKDGCDEGTCSVENRGFGHSRFVLQSQHSYRTSNRE